MQEIYPRPEQVEPVLATNNLLTALRQKTFPREWDASHYLRTPQL
jgi:hypothetical protein